MILLTVCSYPSDPYRRICIIIDLSKGKIKIFRLRRLSKSLRRNDAKVGQCKKKCSLVSRLFVPHKQKGSIVSLKLCLNLCSRRWLRPRRRRVNSFIPRGWWIPYTLAAFGRINLSSARLNISSEEEFWMSGSSWFQLKIEEEKYVDLKRCSGESIWWSMIWTKAVTTRLFNRINIS